MFYWLRLFFFLCSWSLGLNRFMLTSPLANRALMSSEGFSLAARAALLWSSFWKLMKPKLVLVWTCCGRLLGDFTHTLVMVPNCSKTSLSLFSSESSSRFLRKTLVFLALLFRF